MNHIPMMPLIDHVLRREHKAYQIRIPLDNFSADFNEIFGYGVREGLLQINADVYSEDLGPKHIELVVEYPKNWWEHFKQDHMPVWFTKKYPVLMQKETKTADITTKVLYPEFTTSKTLPYVIHREIK